MTIDIKATRPPSTMAPDRSNSSGALGGPSVVVVGGGIAGLAAAHWLSQRQPSVKLTLVEVESRIGGKIVTERDDGLVIEGGPDSFLSTKPGGIALCGELGLTEALIGPTPRPHRAFVRRAGRLHELPEGLTGLVPTRLGPIARSGLLSPRGRARLALDYLLPARRDDDDESVGAFIRRRLGREAYEWLVEPLMAGIYAGDGDRLSLAATFPNLREAERRHGGLIRGVLAARAAAATSAPQPGAKRWPPFVTPAAGLGSLVGTLRDQIEARGGAIVTGRPVTAIEREGGQYRIRVAGDAPRLADGVILATPAFAAAEVVASLDAPLATLLAGIPYASSAIVSLAYPRRAIRHSLDAHGYVVPRAERSPILACTWSSAKWANRAPEETALLRVFIGRYGQTEATAGSDDDLRRLAQDEVAARLGTTEPPHLTRVHRWPRGMPQYTLGHRQRLAAIERQLDALPGLALAGAAYRGVGLPDCITSGQTAAERIEASLQAHSRLA